jgi:hypothetical protein
LRGQALSHVVRKPCKRIPLNQIIDIQT